MKSEDRSGGTGIDQKKGGLGLILRRNTVLTVEQGSRPSSERKEGRKNISLQLLGNAQSLPLPIRGKGVWGAFCCANLTRSY